MIKMKGVGRTVGLVLWLAWMCRADVDVTIAWDPSVTDVHGQNLESSARYKLFFSDSPGVYSDVVDSSTATETVVTGLEYNKVYYFQAKAYTSDSESDYSETFEWKSPPMPDADEDQLSDKWEVRHFGRLDLAHHLTDLDGDGTLDVDEFLAGTNPLDPTDCPDLTIQAAAIGVTVSFEARQPSGEGYENRLRYYSLMQCSDLSNGIWARVPGFENIPGENQTVRREVEWSEQQIYYRMEIRLN